MKEPEVSIPDSSRPLQHEASRGKDTGRVQVVNPERVGDREPYVLYTVRTRKTPSEEDSQGVWQVKRRFTDFVQLRKALRESSSEGGGAKPFILPPLPSKGNFGKQRT